MVERDPGPDPDVQQHLGFPDAAAGGPPESRAGRQEAAAAGFADVRGHDPADPARGAPLALRPGRPQDGTRTGLGKVALRMAQGLVGVRSPSGWSWNWSG